MVVGAAGAFAEAFLTARRHQRSLGDGFLGGFEGLRKRTTQHISNKALLRSMLLWLSSRDRSSHEKFDQETGGDTTRPQTQERRDTATRKQQRGRGRSGREQVLDHSRQHDQRLQHPRALTEHRICRSASGYMHAVHISLGCVEFLN